MATEAGRLCQRCLDLADAGKIRYETLMPLRGGARDALARDGSGVCCIDCDTADLLQRITSLPTFAMARVAVGNARQEHLRLPSLLPQHGLGIPLKDSTRALDDHLAWLDDVLPAWQTLQFGDL